MSLRLYHRTTYTFKGDAVLGPHLIRLYPQQPAKPRIESHAIALTGGGSQLRRQSDAFGNMIGQAVFSRPASRLDITVELQIDPVPVDPFDFLLSPEVTGWPIAYSPEERAALQPYLSHAVAGPRLSAFLGAFADKGTDVVGFVVALNQAVLGAIAHERRHEPGTLDPETVLARGHGACRDSSWVLVQALRHKGIASRFVSGYLLKLHEPEGIRAGLHAWAEAFLPGAGWIGLDPSHGLLAGERYIALAAAPHWRQAAPVTGSASLVGELAHEIRLEAL